LGKPAALLVARRLVEHLERSGFVVMKKPPIGGAAGRGYEASHFEIGSEGTVTGYLALSG
jgi:hypothetical protein